MSNEQTDIFGFSMPSFSEGDSVTAQYGAIDGDNTEIGLRTEGKLRESTEANFLELVTLQDLANILAPEDANPDKEGAVVRKSIQTGIPADIVRWFDNQELTDTGSRPVDSRVLSKKAYAIDSEVAGNARNSLKNFISESSSNALLVRDDIPRTEAILESVELTRRDRNDGAVTEAIVKKNIKNDGYTREQVIALSDAGYILAEPFPETKHYVDENGVDRYRYEKFRFQPRGVKGQLGTGLIARYPMLPEWYMSQTEIDERVKAVESKKKVSPEQAIKERVQAYGREDIVDLLKRGDQQTVMENYVAQRRDELYIMLRMSEKYGKEWHEFDNDELTSAVKATAKELGMNPDAFFPERFTEVGIGRNTDISTAFNIFHMHDLVYHKWTLAPEEAIEIIKNPEGRSIGELYGAEKFIEAYTKGIRGRTWGNAVVEGTAFSLRFGIETALTHGATVWLKPLVAASGASKGTELTIKFANMLRGEVLRTAAEAPLEAVKPVLDADGDIGKAAKDATMAVAKRGVSNVVERTGEFIPSGVFGKWVKKLTPKWLTQGRVGSAIESARKVTGTNGLVGEYIEEKIEAKQLNDLNFLASQIGLIDKPHYEKIVGTPKEEAQLLATIMLTKLTYTGAMLPFSSRARTLRMSEAYSMLADQLEESALKSRSPETVEAFLRDNAKMDEYAYLAPENVEVLFQDSSDLSKRLGISPADIGMAKTSGRSIPVSLPKLHAYCNSDEIKKVLDAVKFDPTDEFTSQAARDLDLRGEQERRTNELLKEREAILKAYSNITEQLNGLGRSAAEVSAASKILYAFADYFAGHSNMKVSDWLNNVAFKMVGEDAIMPEGQESVAGATSFNENWEATIELFAKNTNPSTLIHEISHYAFTMMRHLVDTKVADERMAKDFEALQAWAKEETDSEKAMKEKLARGFESYVMQGEAPKIELQGAFATLRRLMGRVYENADAIGAVAPGEVHSVFNGMLATDETIRNEAIISNVAKSLEAGLLDLSHPEAQVFLDLMEQATVQANEALTSDKARALRKLKKQWRSEAKLLMKGDPAYNAWTAIQKEGGIDYHALEEIVGEWMAQRLWAKGLTTAPGRKIKEKVDKESGEVIPGGYQNAKAGKHPATFAEANGFESVEEMVGALDIAMSPEEFVQDYIAGNESRFHETYHMTDEAQSTQATIDALKVLSDILAEKAGATTKEIRREELKRQAQEAIDKLKVSQVMSDNRQIGDCKQNARDLIGATNKGDYITAFENAKNLYTNLNILKYKADARKRVNRTARMIKRGIHAEQGSIDDKYQEALLDLAYHFKFTKKEHSGSTVENVISAYNEEHEKDGIEIVVSKTLLEEKNKESGKNYTQLTFGEFIELANLAQFLYIEGRAIVSRERKAKFEEQERDVNGVLGELAEHEEKYTNDKFSPRYLTNALLSSGSKLRNMFGMAAKWVEDSVLMNQYNKLVQAEGDHMRIMLTPLKAVNDALKALEKSAAGWNLGELRDIKFPDPVRRTGGKDYRSLTPSNIVAICLNMGTAKGVQRLQDGFEWRNVAGEAGRDNLQRIASLLSAEDWANIQKVWDAIGEETELGDLVRKTFRSVYHYRMSEEDAQAFDVITSDGQTITVKGGYYPLHYLKTKVGDVSNNQAPPQYRRADFTFKRAENLVRPVDLSLSHLYTHIFDAARFATHTKVMRDVLGVMTDERVAYSFQSRQGYARYKDMIDLLHNMADPRKWLQDQASIIERWGKGALSATALWFNPSVVLSQLSSITIGLDEVADSYLPALKRFAMNPVAMFHEVSGKSGFIAERYKVKDLDVGGEVMKFRNNFAEKGMDFLRDIGFKPMQLVDMSVVVPAWMAAYDKAIAETGQEAKAIAYADEFVAKTQGGSRTIDLSPSQLRSWGRAFNVFFAPTSAAATTATATISKVLSKKAGATAIMANVIGGTVLSCMMRWVYAKLTDDDDKDKRTKGKKKKKKTLGRAEHAFIKELVLRPFMGVPYVRDIADVLYTHLVDKGYSRHEAISAGGTQAVNKIIMDAGDTLQAAKEGEWDKVTYNAAKVVSEVFKVPVFKARERVFGKPEFESDKKKKRTARYLQAR